MSTTDTIGSATTASTAARDIPTREIKVSRVYIKATAGAIWTALTDPEWTNRYGYTGYAHYDLRPGGALRIVPNDEFKAGAEAQGFPCPDVIVDGEVVDVDAPHRLVTTWRLLMDPTTAAEPMTTITYPHTPAAISSNDTSNATWPIRIAGLKMTFAEMQTSRAGSMPRIRSHEPISTRCPRAEFSRPA